MSATFLVTGCRLWMHFGSVYKLPSCGEFSCLCITYIVQLQILEKYWKNWKRNMAATVDFQFERYWFSNSSVCGKLSDDKGQEWEATLIDSEVS